ncbi:MAG: hypothetical protein OEZ23_00155 [Gammaproteobacteria bacterium]|nr:hypothetical protein [Gammaproteobacteria bacterium]
MDPTWVAIRVKLYGGFSGMLPASLEENFEKLSDAEKFQVMSYCEAIVNSIDNVLYQRELGLMNEVDVVALESHIVEQSALWNLSRCHVPRRVAEVYERKGRAGDV